MADPLMLLREYVSGGRIEEVVLTGDRVDFGGKFSFSKDVSTGYKSGQVRAGRLRAMAGAAPPPPPLSQPPLSQPLTRRRRASPLQGKGDFYDLETLLFFAKKLTTKFTDYFKAARETGKPPVTFVDRKVRAAACGCCCAAMHWRSLERRPACLHMLGVQHAATCAKLCQLPGPASRQPPSARSPSCLPAGPACALLFVRPHNNRCRTCKST